jgi:uncharacterized membrane protein
MAKKKGRYIIEAPKVKAGGKIISGRAVAITVKEGAVAGNSAAKQNRGQSNVDDRVFIKTIVSNRNPYLGEQVEIAFKLYFDVNVGNLNIEANDYENLWVEEIDLGKNFPVSKENIGGKVYTVATVKKLMAYPTKVGKIRSPSLVLSLDARFPERRRRTRTLFDDFFDNPFGRTRRITVSAKTVTLNVLPLPEHGKPKNFSGLVGHFSFKGRVDKDSAKVNEPVTVKYELRGKGNLYLFSEPKINYSNEFEVYPGSLKKIIDWNKRSTAIGKWEQVIIPRVPGNLVIPAYTISWFDPAKKKYITSGAGPYNVKVAGDVRRNYTGTSSVVNRRSVEALGRDIHYLKPVGEFYPRGNSYWYNARFFVFLMLSLLVVISGFGYDKYRSKVESDRGWTRSRKAAKIAKKRLARAEAAMEGSNDEFFGELEKGIIGFITDRLNLPPAALSSSEAVKFLREKKLDETTLDKLSEILSSCQLKRYAPADTGKEERSEILLNAKNVLRDLQRNL